MTASLENMRLSPWYLNTRRLGLATNTDFGTAAQTSLNANSDARVMGMRRASSAANDILASGNVPNLTRTLLAGASEGDRITAAIWGLFTFRGLTAAFMSEHKGKPVKPGTFSALIPIGSDEFELFGQLSNDHVYSDTAVGLLSGKRRCLMMGQFDIQGSKIEVFPWVIGDYIVDLGFTFSVGGRGFARVYPESIDAFSEMKDVRSPSLPQMKILEQIPEAYVKKAFADIIGEPFIDKDWGGEKSDLSTSRLQISGKPLSAAFLLKGPAVKGPMYPANLGKRGDQLIRAFDEPAQLIIVQHCHKIENSVVRQAEALAVDPSKPRQYCIIDGADTYRILKAYDKLPLATNLP